MHVAVYCRMNNIQLNIPDFEDMGILHESEYQESDEVESQALSVEE